jgi:hypothetical protein
MPITSEFSLQNSTVEVFDNSTTAQQTALNTLRTAIKNATTDMARVSAYNTFFGTTGVGGLQSGTITITTAGATANASYAGTWANASGSGFWISTAATATSITATLYATSGTVATPLTLALADLSNYWTSGNATKGTPSAVTTSVTLAAATGGSKLGKITGIGETGKSFTVVSAKLVSESGTIKAKGSSDEGDLTIDYISIPGDTGQLLMESAFDDETINGNRVFRITHTTSGAKVYLIGMVTELKKARGAVDNFATVKAKITLQDGVAEDNPA